MIKRVVEDVVETGLFAVEKRSILNRSEALDVPVARNESITIIDATPGMQAVCACSTGTGHESSQGSCGRVRSEPVDYHQDENGQSSSRSEPFQWQTGFFSFKDSPVNRFPPGSHEPHDRCDGEEANQRDQPGRVGNRAAKDCHEDGDQGCQTLKRHAKAAHCEGQHQIAAAVHDEDFKRVSVAKKHTLERLTNQAQARHHQQHWQNDRRFMDHGDASPKVESRQDDHQRLHRDFQRTPEGIFVVVMLGQREDER